MKKKSLSKHYTDSERLSLLEEFNTSGLSMSQFSRKIGIDMNTLRSWIRKHDGKSIVITNKPSVKQYTISEKISLLHQYHASGMSLSGFYRATGVSSGSITRWMSDFGLSGELTNEKIEMLMRNEKKKDDESLIDELRRENERLMKENKTLDRKLKEANLIRLADKMLIDLAESTYHIKIRKNSDAK